MKRTTHAKRAGWFSYGKPLSKRKERTLTVCSFLLPLVLWAIVSYCPFIWHPEVLIEHPGDSLYFAQGDRIETDLFIEQNQELKSEQLQVMEGDRVNPVYLPAPHQVAYALVDAFKTPPRRNGDPWFHESVIHSVQIVFIGFLVSSIFGIPLGIMCGFFPMICKLFEPFIEFFRYFPAPVFGALAVAMLGINDAPKISIIMIGTFFQQVLVMANTTRRMDYALVEAAQTLGCSTPAILCKVVIPSILPKLFLDLRILLGWAWTYLIVAEVIGTSTGISWFINQQAKYRVFENVYAAILVLGFIGLATDMLLAWFGRSFFAWERGQKNPLLKYFKLNSKPAENKA